MAIEIPEFDFKNYDPRNPWNFPGQRLVNFAAQAYNLFAESRQSWTRLYPHPDLRSVVFHEMAQLTHAMLLGAMHLRSEGQKLEWWKAQPELTHPVNAQLASANNQGMRSLLQLGLMEGMLRQLTMTIQQLVKVLELEEVTSGPVPLKQAWRKLLEETGLKGYRPLLELLQVQRDAIGQHGKYFSVLGRPLDVRFGGHHMQANTGQELDFQAWGFLDDWDFVLFLLQEIDSLLNDLIKSAPISRLPFVATSYLS